MNITQLLNKTTNTSKPNWENLNSSSITGVLSKLNLTNLNNQLIKANIYNESTAMEYLNLDPFLLYLSTVNISGCPLANDKTGNFCMYPRSTRWNCTAGNFCMAANHPSSCLPGFFCPENATQAVYCPPGYYCSADSKTIDICPDGYVCPLSTVNPISCGGLAYCPAGSFKVYRIGYAGVFFFVMIVAIFGSIASTRIKNLKNRRFNQSIRKVADPTICNNEKIENYSRLNVEFKDISLTLPNGQNILRGISGSFKSGKMCAIMGPSGSGKTSLLSILLGHVRPTTGEILVNGKHASLKEYSTELGFVPQDDVMYRNLSIREILQHSANTRLPHHMDYFQRNQKVIDVLKMLGIESISHKVVGDAEKRGISGGQRKRVNIAIELVTNPMILFLDEPTTGLDSSTSTSLCQNLSEIAQTSNLCIASIIHSPSVAAFRQFDDLLLLGKGGKLIYHGSRIDALQYFHFIGFTCPKRESPADFYINVISGKVPSEYNPAFISTDLSEYWKLYCSGELNFEIGKRMTPQEAIDAQIAYLKNPVLLERQNTQLITARSNYKLNLASYFSIGFTILKMKFSHTLESFKSHYSSNVSYKRLIPPFQYQIIYSVERAMSLTLFMPNLIFPELALHYLFGVFLGIGTNEAEFYGKLPSDLCVLAPFVLQDLCSSSTDTLKQTLTVLILGNLFCGIASGVKTFGSKDEKMVCKREKSTGVSIFYYFIGKVIADIPRAFISSILYGFGILTGFPFRGNPWNVITTVIGVEFVAFPIGYIIGILCETRYHSILNAFYSILGPILLSGHNPALNEIHQLPEIFKIIWDTSPARWELEAYWLLEIQARPFTEKNMALENGYNWSNGLKCQQNLFLLSVLYTLLAMCILIYH